MPWNSKTQKTPKHDKAKPSGKSDRGIKKVTALEVACVFSKSQLEAQSRRRGKRHGGSRWRGAFICHVIYRVEADPHPPTPESGQLCVCGSLRSRLKSGAEMVSGILPCKDIVTFYLSFKTELTPLAHSS